MKTNILRSRLTPLLLGLAMAIVLPLAVAKPADATWNCGGSGSNYLCLYEHINYDGTYEAYGNPSSGYCYNVSPQMNDKTSSIHNYTSKDFRFYANANCSGLSIRVNAGQSDDNLTCLFCGLNDAISSLRSIN